MEFKEKITPSNRLYWGGIGEFIFRCKAVHESWGAQATWWVLGECKALCLVDLGKGVFLEGRGAAGLLLEISVLLRRRKKNVLKIEPSAFQENK